jgi:hypothetical protein
VPGEQSRIARVGRDRRASVSGPASAGSLTFSGGSCRVRGRLRCRREAAAGRTRTGHPRRPARSRCRDDAAEVRITPPHRHGPDLGVDDDPLRGADHHQPRPGDRRAGHGPRLDARRRQPRSAGRRHLDRNRGRHRPGHDARDRRDHGRGPGRQVRRRIGRQRHHSRTRRGARHRRPRQHGRPVQTPAQEPANLRNRRGRPVWAATISDYSAGPSLPAGPAARTSRPPPPVAASSRRRRDVRARTAPPSWTLS